MNQEINATRRVSRLSCPRRRLQLGVIYADRYASGRRVTKRVPDGDADAIVPIGDSARVPVRPAGAPEAVYPVAPAARYRQTSAVAKAKLRSPCRSRSGREVVVKRERTGEEAVEKLAAQHPYVVAHADDCQHRPGWVQIRVEGG
jgi:hypothetical protein